MTFDQVVFTRSRTDRAENSLQNDENGSGFRNELSG